jgi:ABC-type sugar transport system permease subunit
MPHTRSPPWRRDAHRRAAGKPGAVHTIIALLIAPYAINEVSAVAMWRFVLEPDIGMVSWALMQLGIGQLDWSADPQDALALAALLSIRMHTPFTFLILYQPVDEFAAA